jgi:hypothetical protein
MIFKSFNAQLNSVQTLLIYCISISIFLLYQIPIKVSKSDFGRSEMSQKFIAVEYPISNQEPFFKGEQV